MLRQTPGVDTGMKPSRGIQLSVARRKRAPGRSSPQDRAVSAYPCAFEHAEFVAVADLLPQRQEFYARPSASHGSPAAPGRFPDISPAWQEGAAGPARCRLMARGQPRSRRTQPPAQSRRAGRWSPRKRDEARRERVAGPAALVTPRGSTACTCRTARCPERRAALRPPRTDDYDGRRYRSGTIEIHAAGHRSRVRAEQHPRRRLPVRCNRRRRRRTAYTSAATAPRRRGRRRAAAGRSRCGDHRPVSAEQGLGEHSQGRRPVGVLQVRVDDPSPPGSRSTTDGQSPPGQYPWPVQTADPQLQLTAPPSRSPPRTSPA